MDGFTGSGDRYFGVNETMKIRIPLWFIPIFIPIVIAVLSVHQNREQEAIALNLMDGRAQINARLTATFIRTTAGRENSSILRRMLITRILKDGRPSTYRFVINSEDKVIATSDEAIAPRGVRLAEVKTKMVGMVAALRSRDRVDIESLDYANRFEVGGATWSVNIKNIVLARDNASPEPLQLIALTDLSQDINAIRSRQDSDLTETIITLSLLLALLIFVVVRPVQLIAIAVASKTALPKRKWFIPSECQNLIKAIAIYRRTIEQSLKQIDLSSTGLMIMQWQGNTARILAVNPALAKMTGFTAEELTGSKLNKIVPTEYHKYHELDGGEWSSDLGRRLGVPHYLNQCPHARSHIVGTPRSVKFITNSGAERDATLGIDLISAKDGTFVGSLTDVTDLVAAIAQSARDAEEIKRVNHIAVHDIKADLIALSKGSEMILDAAAELVGQVQGSENELLLDAVDTIATFSELNMKSAENAFEVLDSRNKLYDLDSKIEIEKHNVAEIVEALKAIAVTETHTISITNSCPENCRILCDKSLFLSVLKNIIRNGILHNNSEQKRVDVVVSDRGNSVVFEISDNGVGMSADYLAGWGKTLGKAAQASDRGGSGTGLYSVKTIMSAHEKYGASVAISSEVDVGTKFTLSLRLG